MNLRHLLKNGCKPKISIEEGFKELATQTNQHRSQAANLFDKVMRKPEERNLARLLVPLILRNRQAEQWSSGQDSPCVGG